MEKLLWKEKLSYGIGAYGKDFIYNMIAAFLMIFYTDVVGVSLIFEIGRASCRERVSSYV